MVSRDKSSKKYQIGDNEDVNDEKNQPKSDRMNEKEDENEDEDENLVHSFHQNDDMTDETSSPSHIRLINGDERDDYFQEVVRLKSEKITTVIRDSSSINGSMTESRSSLKQKPVAAPNIPEVNVQIDGSIDWYGNTCLHHLFAVRDIEASLIERAVNDYPSCISQQNQFGRLPLHYAVDRSQVNIKGLEILLHYYPQGVQITDNDGKTPYDIARKWEHSRPILLKLLTLCPDLDKGMYMKLKYGPIGSLAHWASNSFRAALAGDDDNNNHNRPSDEQDETLLEETTITQAISGSRTSFSTSQHNILIENTVFAPALSRSQSRRFSADNVRSFSVDTTTNV